MSSEDVVLEPIVEVTPESVSEVSEPGTKPVQDSSEPDAEEREYQEAMAKLAKKDTKEPELEDGEDTPDADIDSEGSNKPVVKPKEDKAPQVWKLKVNGSEVEFDASDEGRVKQAVQKGLAADAKFQEASTMSKRAEGFLRALKQNPEQVLAHPSLGINLREFAENYLYKQIQQESLTPEQRQQQAERDELERYRQTEQQRKAEADTRAREEMKERYRQDYAKQFTEALETGGVPKTDWTVQRMAQYMKQAISKGYKHVKPQDVVTMVKQDWINAQRQMFEHLDGDKLIETVGQDVADKIRKANLAKMQAAKAVKQASAPAQAKQPQRTYRSTEELLRAISEGKA